MYIHVCASINFDLIFIFITFMYFSVMILYIVGVMVALRSNYQSIICKRACQMFSLLIYDLLLEVYGTEFKYFDFNLKFFW